MRAEITSDGFLKVTAETHVEAYALKCWWAGYRQDDLVGVPKPGLAVDYTLRPSQTKVEE